jgi:hypothetical protein
VTAGGRLPKRKLNHADIVEPSGHLASDNPYEAYSRTHVNQRRRALSLSIFVNDVSIGDNARFREPRPIPKSLI